MHIIEKTQINAGAFITLISTLKRIQSDNLTEIIDNGKGVLIREKTAEEKENLTLDLNPLNEIFNSFLIKNRGPYPLILNSEQEEYLRNCSFACYFYRPEENIRGPFDTFNLFHKTHFDRSDARDDKELLKLFFGLFGIDPTISISFINDHLNINTWVELPTKETYNQIFNRFIYTKVEGSRRLTLISTKLQSTESLDSLFVIKDLLTCRGIDTSAIPEYGVFSIQYNEEVKFQFTSLSGFITFEIFFKYDRLVVEISTSQRGL